ncbi:hypothetical protein PZA11_008010 [Diplocarpon coronariae]
MAIDIALLHDIVVLAQEILPKLSERERLPTNALFSAYYDILPRIGINADHDSRYARVLFKIGGLRGPGTLYEKFEEILSRLGIEIEFDQDNNDTEAFIQAEDLQQDLDGGIGSDGLTPTGYTDGGKVLKWQRRNSESSLWSLGVEIQSPTTRRKSFSTVEYVKSRVKRPQEILHEAIWLSMSIANGFERYGITKPQAGGLEAARTPSPSFDGIIFSQLQLEESACPPLRRGTTASRSPIWNAWKVWRMRQRYTFVGSRSRNLSSQDSLLRHFRRNGAGETRVIPARITVQSDVTSRMLEAFPDGFTVLARNTRRSTLIEQGSCKKH